MSRITVNLRKDCMKQALQMWLDSMNQPGLKVVDIIKPDPPEMQVVVDDGLPEEKKEGGDGA